MGKENEESSGWQRFRDRFNAEKHFDDGERELAKLEIAWAKASLHFRTGDHFGHNGMRMQSLIRIHQKIDVHRRRFENGETMSLLQAVAMCAEENLPLPTWLALAYCAALQSFGQAGGPVSLDAVFRGPQFPTDTPKKAASARQDWQLGALLRQEAWEVALADESLKSFDAVVERVLSLRDFGVRKTKAKALIQLVEKVQLEFLVQSKSLSRYLEIRRKRFPIA